MGRLFSIGFWPGSSSAVVPFLVSWTDAMQLSNPSESQFHPYGIKAVSRLSTTEEGKVSEGFLVIGLSKIEKHYTSPTRTCNKICMHGCVITMSLAALDGTAGGNQGFINSLSRSPAAESEYISGMTQHQNEVLLQDDKDKKATWTMSFACLSAIFMSLVLMDPQWEVTTMSPASLSVLVHGVSLFAIPAFMRKGPLHKGSYAPYMYPFVKAKCFSATGGHTCSKANHSCLRKVVSFFKSPWRRAWRLAGRAIQVLISLTGDGFSVWQLKQIIPTFRARMAKLRVSQQPGQCTMCGKCKPFTSLLIADAAQMYEQINTILVLEAFDAKAATLRSEKGADAITVAKARLVKGWPGGSEHARSRACITFPLWRLRRMLQASCSLRFASVGDLVVAAKGLMIGGLLSMIAAICLLSHEEE